nr:hypothetical protein [Leeuwenhoekiella sp. UBA6783]
MNRKVHLVCVLGIIWRQSIGEKRDKTAKYDVYKTQNAPEISFEFLER